MSGPEQRDSPPRTSAANPSPGTPPISGRPESMDVPLDFLTDEERRTDSQEYSRPPTNFGIRYGPLEPNKKLGCNPTTSLCFWDDQNGFYTISNDDRLEIYPRLLEEDAASTIGTGWFYVIPKSELG